MNKLQLANEAFRANNYSKAISLYKSILKEPTELSEVLRFNIQLTESKLRQFILSSDINQLPNKGMIENKDLFWYTQGFISQNRLNDAIKFAEKFATQKDQVVLDLLYANMNIMNEKLWLKHLNNYLNTYDMPSLKLLDLSNKSYLERLSLEDDFIKVIEGPLVSIIMPAFNAEKTINFATKSVLNQSWQRIELIIIDDASSDNTWSKLQNIAKNDSRVKILRNKVNVGPYVSKNIALKYVTGEYITGHDADDWSHPLQIEKHIKYVLQSKNKIKASATYMLRVKQNGMFSHFSKRGGISFDGVARLSSISCLFDAEFFKNNLGYWDSVRFGGDSEIISRAQKILGEDFVKLRQIGMLCLDLESSLTNNVVTGVSKLFGVSDIRSRYAKSWSDWHKNANLSELYIPYTHYPRKFVAPEEMQVPVTVPQVFDNQKQKIGLQNNQFLLFRDYVKIAKTKKNDECLDQIILITGSINGRELLVFLALEGRLDYKTLLHILENFKSPVFKPYALEQLATVKKPIYLIRLARVLIAQQLEPDDVLNALTLVQAIIDIHGVDIIPVKYTRLFTDAAILIQEIELAQKLFGILSYSSEKNDKQYLLCDFANPALGGNDKQAWALLVNSFFEKINQGLVQISLDLEKSNLAAFDRLCVTHLPDPIINGPLVTVVMSAYCPSQEIFTSVNSILSQTWENIELIIINDASPIEYAGVFEQCKQMDKRIKILHHETNQGTYVARNNALMIAQGDFITFQDSDDWSHPRRIEEQVKFMNTHKTTPACMGYYLRCDENLLLSLFGSSSIQLAACTLFYRRKMVVDKIGFFDSVRKAADTEYVRRIEVTFNTVVLKMDAGLLLGLYRLNKNSLSRQEFRLGWHHPVRAAYKGAYNFWHKKILDGASPYLEFSIETRKFPAPLRYFIDRQDMISRSKYDVVFIGDWIKYGGPQKSMIEEIKALKSANLKIAICHMDVFRFMGSTQVRQKNIEIQGLINSGEVDEVLLDDKIEVKLMILRYPLILQFTSSIKSNWKIGYAMIIANQAPYELNGSDYRYYVGDCIRNAYEIFGVHPKWVPMGPLVRNAIEPLLPKSLLSSQDCPGIIDCSRWKILSNDFVSDKPVIGRYSRDNEMKFPSTLSTLLQIYPDDGAGIEVKIMGGDNTCASIFKERPIPRNWQMLKHGAIPVYDFLNSIDFFVYYDNDNIVEAFGRSILEALASGKVVILPEKFREVFGSGALYTEPCNVQALVWKLYKSPSLYKEQRDKALDYVEKYFSYNSYVEKILKITANLSSDFC